MPAVCISTVMCNLQCSTQYECTIHSLLRKASCVCRAVLSVVAGASSQIIAVCPAALSPVSHLGNSFTCAYAFVWATLQMSCILSVVQSCKTFQPTPARATPRTFPRAPHALTRAVKTAPTREKESPALHQPTAPHRTAPHRTPLSPLGIERA